MNVLRLDRPSACRRAFSAAAAGLIVFSAPAGAQDAAPVLLKIFEAEKMFGEHSANPGDISTDGKTFFRIASSDGWVDVRSMQLAGKKRMSVEDFLRGYRHGAGTVVR